MPITTRADSAETYGDKEHWKHVMESLFVPAIESAGYEAIRPIAKGAHLIHSLIIRHLSTADLILCDLSSHNPNVFFELGVRTSLNLPIALVVDERTEIPFDPSGINTHSYDSAIRTWEINDAIDKLREHIEASARSCAGTNPLWRQFGLDIRAKEPTADKSPLEAKVELLADRMQTLQRGLNQDRQIRQAIDTRRARKRGSYDEDTLSAAMLYGWAAELKAVCKWAQADLARTDSTFQIEEVMRLEYRCDKVIQELEQHSRDVTELSLEAMFAELQEIRHSLQLAGVKIDDVD